MTPCRCGEVTAASDTRRTHQRFGYRKRGLLAWLETANAGIMSDTEEQLDLDAARLAMFVERCYTLGWRAYLDGRPCPKHQASERGWTEAKHAREVCDREIMWSMDIKFIAPNSI